MIERFCRIETHTHTHTQRRNQGGRAGATAPPKISENF